MTAGVPTTEDLYRTVPPDLSHWVAGLGLQQTVGGVDARAVIWRPVPYPATESTVAEAPCGDSKTVDAAVQAAHGAFSEWCVVPWAERRQALVRFAEELEANVGALSFLLAAETGRPLRRCAMEVTNAGRFIRTIVTADAQEEQLRHPRASVRFLGRPLGVVAAIAPWNSPILLATVKVANALLAGNTVVLKPSPFTPLSMLLAGRLSRSVLPPGVLNIVNGDVEVGAALVRHPNVSKVSFTGSTATGRVIAQVAASELKRVTLELGGNDAAIVLEDADLDAVVEVATQTGLLNCGAFCAGVKRVYVQRSAHDELVRRFASRIENVVVGDGLQSSTDMGPVQNRPQYDRVRTLRAEAVASNATLHEPAQPPPEGGLYLAPALVEGLSSSHRLVREEQFGPLLPILPFDNVREAIADANDSPYGLGGSIWTGDVARGAALARELDVGSAWVNQHGAFDPAIPMPFAKDSGIGIDYGGLGVASHTQRMIINVLDAP